MTGFDVTDELRRRYPEQLPPLVALTANLINNQQQYQQHGMQSVIGKPLSLDNLRKTLNEIFIVCSLPVEPRTTDHRKNICWILISCRISLVSSGVMCKLPTIDLFEQSMPEYLDILNSALTARDKQGIVEEA